MKRLLACSLVGLTACVGPNFQKPAPPNVGRYTTQELPAATSAAEGADGAAQRFLSDDDVPRDWWTLFGSGELNTLVSESLRANPDVHSAQAALRQAQENTAAQRGSWFPAVDGTFDASRNRDATGVLSPNLTSGSPLYNLFTPQVTVSYVPDIFGANKRQVESLAAQAEAARYQLDATYLTLTANVVGAAIQEAALRAQIASTKQVIQLFGESLQVLEREVQLGAIAEGEVYAQQAALAQLEATMPPLRRQLEQTRDQLAMLSGRLPAEFMPPRLELDGLVLPVELPLGVPSQAALPDQIAQNTDLSYPVIAADCRQGGSGWPPRRRVSRGGEGCRVISV